MRLLVILALFSSLVSCLPCGVFLDNSTLLAFYPDGIDLQTSPSNPSHSSTLDFQGLSLTLNPSNGQLQVVETANQNVVWGWGISGKTCKSGNCHLVFQSDGNFVLYYPDGSAIGTSTYNQNAAFVLFSTSPPYVTVVDTQCKQLWPTSSDKPTVGPLPRTTPPSGPTFDVKVNLQALPASSWRAHFGVNTHCSQGWNSAMVYNMTTYLDVSVIRDELPSASQAADYARMFAKGIRLNVVAGGAANKSELSLQVQAWSNFEKTMPGMLQQIEGFNEINNFGFVYNGINPKQTYAGMAQAMKDLYSLVRSTSNLNGIPVLDLTGGNFLDGPNVGLTNYTGHADLGTIHNYAYNGQPSITIAGTLNLFLLGLSWSYPDWKYPTSNFAITEIGYHSSNFSNGVTEVAQSKLIVNTLLNGILVGFRQTFIYELYDEQWTGYNGPESHFGLFRHDQTPKPAARALHFLSALLADSKVNPSPATFNFMLQGVPVGAEYLLFQNSAGTAFLVLFSNAPVYDPISQTDIVSTPVKVTLAFSSTQTISLYDIYSLTADDTKPLPPTTTVTAPSLQFNMGDQAVVISF